MQSHRPRIGSMMTTSFLSLPFEIREQIYRGILRSLPRVKPMLYSPTIPIYCLQSLDPRPLFVHPQIQHDIEVLLASHTRVRIPASLGHNDESPLSPSTQQWLRETRIEFKRIRIWSGLPLPIILDVNIVAGTEVTVQYKWRLTPGKWRLYTWGRWILRPALPVMFKYLAEGLRKRIAARSGTGIGIGEIDFLIESMSRFRSWFEVHRRFRSDNSRLSSGSYERDLDNLYHHEEDDKEDFRRRLEWWDDVEAEVRDLEMDQNRMLP